MKQMSFDFKSRRSMVVARRGMVAASNPMAAQAGLNILRQGGNAADAAIAAAGVMNVTAPASTGVGGDCFALYYDAKTRKVTALNGSGRAPAELSIDHLQKEGISGEMPERSVHAITVPGAVMGWHDLLERHGTMTLADVLVDAIHYASEGYGVSPIFGTMWGSENTEKFLKSMPNTEDYVPGGRTPKTGEIIDLPGLASTLRAVAEGGPQAFYTGKIADAIVSTVQEQGGLLTHDDLKNHKSSWAYSISTDYRGVTVHEHPPNGQGLAALIAMNIANEFDLASMPWDDPQRMHLMIEAMRLAFADARQYIADPDMSKSTDWLLGKEYAAQRRTLIDPNKAQHPSFGMPLDSSDTIYLCVVDGEGNGCSFINSLYMGFGSGIVAKGVGVFLQNRGANFSLEKGHPNALAGGKRPYHTIIPGLVTQDGNLWATFGVMGGFMQPQGHFQVINGLIDDDLNPQDALDRSRWCLMAGTASSTLALEDGISVKTMARLAELGHNVRPVTGRGRGLFGTGQIIRRNAQTGVLFGGSDPRKDGLVAAF
jgi:gamma-glutamyltranspeptidase / glutathione hydrolase